MTRAAMERAVERGTAEWLDENTIRTRLGYIVRLRPDLPGLPVIRGGG